MQIALLVTIVSAAPTGIPRNGGGVGAGGGAGLGVGVAAGTDEGGAAGAGDVSLVGDVAWGLRCLASALAGALNAVSFSSGWAPVG
ncbi:MAG TPA: hypothetical protein VF483_10640 [Gemmatimonadaceae bacterium]